MRNNKFMPLILLLPFIFVTALIIMAAAVVIMQSLGWIPAFGLTELSLQYYAEILTDSDFLSSLSVSLRVSIISTVISAVLGVAICAAIVAGGKGKFPFIVRFPILVPHAVVAVFAINILSQTGHIARAAYALGLIADYSQFTPLLYTESFLGVIVAYVWKEAPFVAFFVYALMVSISSSLGEAAQNLGASPLRSFFAVTLPLSMPAIANASFIIFVFAFAGYELPMLLGSTLPKALPITAFLEFTSPDLLNRPYAMATNGVLLMFAVFAAVLYLISIQYAVKRTGGKNE